MVTHIGTLITLLNTIVVSMRQLLQPGWSGEPWGAHVLDCDTNQANATSLSPTSTALCRVLTMYPIIVGSCTLSNGNNRAIFKQSLPPNSVPALWIHIHFVLLTSEWESYKETSLLRYNYCIHVAFVATRNFLVCSCNPHVTSSFVSSPSNSAWPLFVSFVLLSSISSAFLSLPLYPNLVTLRSVLF